LREENKSSICVEIRTVQKLGRLIFVPISQYLSDIAISVRLREENKSSIREQFIDTSENKMVSEGQTQQKAMLRFHLSSDQSYIAVIWVEE